MNIRQYSSEDYSSIVSIYNTCKLDELQFEEEPFELLPLENDEKRFNTTFASDIFVYEDESILGYGAINDSDLGSLFVLPESRGKGIGKTLLEFILSEVDGEISLQVVKSNLPALNLYLEHGFEIVGESFVDYNNQSVLVCKMRR